VVPEISAGAEQSRGKQYLGVGFVLLTEALDLTTRVAPSPD
jgi:hypothetical protein